MLCQPSPQITHPDNSPYNVAKINSTLRLGLTWDVPWSCEPGVFPLFSFEMLNKCLLDKPYHKANEVSIFTMEVDSVRQDASELEKDVYKSRHTKEMVRTAIVSDSTRVGLVNIPKEDLKAGVRITGGCNATIKLQVIGGKQERKISSDEEKLSIG